MDVIKCIESRHSGRSYSDGPVSDRDMDELIRLGTLAATGSGMQPWGFVVINDRDELDGWSDRIKQYLHGHIDAYPHFKQYESWFTNPRLHVFNRASTALIIFGDTGSHWSVYDCSLAAGNIMLAANSKDIGTCWVGFCEVLRHFPEFKAMHKVPECFELVCAMSMGYMEKRPETAKKRKEPVFFDRQPII